MGYPPPKVSSALMQGVSQLQISIPESAHHWLDSMCKIVGRPSLIHVFSPRIDRGRVCVANGVLDLSDSTLLDHSSTYRFTWRFEAPYDPVATLETFKEFLGDVIRAEATGIRRKYCNPGNNPGTC